MANPVREPPGWPTISSRPRNGRPYRPDAPYLPAAFPQDGFIHTTHTAVEVAAAGNRYYTRDPRPYYAVAIDLRRLTSPWRYDGDERFPHIYGPLNRAAVLAVPPAPRAAGRRPSSRRHGRIRRARPRRPFTTPKIGANAAVFDDAGRILLVQREDNRLWCLPERPCGPRRDDRGGGGAGNEEEPGIVVEPGRWSASTPIRTSAPHRPRPALSHGHHRRRLPPRPAARSAPPTKPWTSAGSTRTTCRPASPPTTSASPMPAWAGNGAGVGRIPHPRPLSTRWRGERPSECQMFAERCSIPDASPLPPDGSARGGRG